MDLNLHVWMVIIKKCEMEEEEALQMKKQMNLKPSIARLKHLTRKMQKKSLLLERLVDVQLVKAMWSFDFEDEVVLDLSELATAGVVLMGVSVELKNELKSVLWHEMWLEKTMKPELWKKRKSDVKLN